MNRRIILCLVLLLCPASAQAATINVGTHTFFTAGPTFVIPLEVTGGDTIRVFDFWNVIGGGNDGHGPIITNINVNGVGGGSPTILNGWDGNYKLPPYGNNTREAAWGGFDSTPGSPTIASGKLINVTLDITGVAFGFYPWSLTSTNGARTQFWANDESEVETILIDGWIQVTDPEPSTMVLGLLAFVGLGSAAVRRRLASKAA